MELSELLHAREERAARQKELLSQYNATLISFTMNIPGPVKNSPLIAEGFRLGIELLRGQFRSVLYQESHTELPTGCQGYYVLQEEPQRVKDICTRLEESSPMGRLFDFDVLTPGGEKLSRSHPRPCLLCGEDARICRRRGSHNLKDLESEVQRLLHLGLDEVYEEDIGALAVRSLLWELCTTPKPGLVDCRNNGSHKDMDLFLFGSSVAALAPYFTQCARLGRESRSAGREELFEALRFAGRQAESNMLRSTGGINTHKGAVFSLGLLCAAAGKLGKKASAREVCEEAALLCRGTLEGELSHLTPSTAETKGERLYCSHGITGARGQALKGFPTVLHTGLPVLEKGLALGYDLNRAGVAALLSMLREEPDTCLISRSSPDRYTALREELEELLRREPYPTTETIEALDDSFIRENLSPGGSADLLALTYFLYGLRRKGGK